MCFFSSAFLVCPMFGTVAEAMKIDLDYFTRTIQSGPPLWSRCSAPAGLCPSWLRVDPMITSLQSKYHPKWKLALTIVLTGSHPHKPFISEELNSTVNAQPSWLRHCLILSSPFTPGPRYCMPTDRYRHFPRFTSYGPAFWNAPCVLSAPVEPSLRSPLGIQFGLLEILFGSNSSVISLFTDSELPQFQILACSWQPAVQVASAVLSETMKIVKLSGQF